MTPKALAKRGNTIKLKIARWERYVSLAQPSFRQVRALVRKFGGIIPFAIAAGEHPDIIVTRWLAKPKPAKVGKPDTMNTDGLIPLRNLTRLLAYARVQGILLDAKDIYPELFEASDLPQTPERLKQWAANLPKSKKMKAFEHILASIHV